MPTAAQRRSPTKKSRQQRQQPAKPHRVGIHAGLTRRVARNLEHEPRNGDRKLPRRLEGEVPGREVGPFFALLDLDLDFNGDPHPNARGHARIAKAVTATIRETAHPTTRIGSVLAIAGVVLLVVLPLWLSRKPRSSSAPTHTP